MPDISVNGETLEWTGHDVWRAEGLVSFRWSGKRRPGGGRETASTTGGHDERRLDENGSLVTGVI